MLFGVVNPSQTRFGLARAQVSHHGLERVLVCLVEQDELVGDDTHLLKGDGLGLGPREALNNPALLSLLHLLDLLLHKLYHNFIFDVTVGF